MKIVFLNVWGGKREAELVEFIRHEARDTDVFCFQEATDEMKHRCRDVLSGYREVSDYKFITEHENFSQSIFVRKNLDLLSSGTLLAHDMEVGLAVYIEIKMGMDSLYVCNVHGRSRPVNKLDNPGRLEQSGRLIKFFENKEVPVVIGGDFNLELHTKSISMFQEHGYQDLIKQFGVDTTRNHFIWDRYPDNKMYYSDYVFLNSKVKSKAFHVPKNEVSDHLPLILEID